MAELSLGYQIIVDSPVAAYGFTKTPPYSRDVSAVNVAAQQGFNFNGLRVIPDAGCVILEPAPAWEDSLLANVTFPSGWASDWTQSRASEIGQLGLTMVNAQPSVGGTGLPAQGQPHTWDVRTTASQAASGAFYVRLSRGQPVAGTDSSGNAVSLTSQNDYAVFIVGENSGASVAAGQALPAIADAGGNPPFRLVFQRGRPAFLQQAQDDGSGTGTLKWGGWGENGVLGTQVADSNTLWENTRVLQVEWLPLPAQNCLVVTLGAGLESLIFRPPAFAAQDDSSTYGDSGVAYQDGDDLAVAAGPLRYYGSGGTAGFEYGPMGFSPSGYLTSPTENLPFVYQGNGTVRLLGLSPDEASQVQSAITTTDNSGTRIAYQVQATSAADDSGTLAAYNLADDTPVITGWQLNIPPTYDYTATISSAADISQYASEIDESVALSWLPVDANTLVPVIRAQVGLNLDNSAGLFTGYGGIHRAVQYSRWLRVKSPVTGLWEDYSEPVPLLAGWCGHDTTVFKADPMRRFDMILDDGAYPLDRVEIGYCDPLDGWCPYAARYFLALLSGRSDAFIGDELKTCSFGADPPGCPHVKLPLGTGVTPRMAFGPNRTYWSAMAEISAFGHELQWCDQSNILHVQPYAQIVAGASVNQVFDIADSGDPTSDDFLSAMWNLLKVNSNTKDRRTGVAFFGLDPGVNTVQGTYLNADDFLGPGWTAAVHGFRDPLTVVSNLFVDPVFTAAYALSALERVTLPTVTVESGACFLPGAYPLLGYSIAPCFAGLAEPPFLITEAVRSRWAAVNPRVFGSTLTGRWFPNTLAAS